MKKLLVGQLLFLFIFLLSAPSNAAEKFSALPRGYASATTSSDLFPFVNSTTGTTEQMTLWDLPNLAPFQSAFSSIAPVYNVKLYGATGNGTSNDYVAVAAAVTACGNAGGGKVYFPAGTYKLSSNLLNLYPNVVFEGDGPSSEILLSDGLYIEDVASNFQVRKMRISGGSYATGTATGKLLYIHGANSSNYISNVSIADSYFDNATFYGIYAQFVNNLSITNNTLTLAYYAAVSLNSVSQFNVSGNNVSFIGPGNSGNAYGIVASEEHILSTTGTATSGSTSISSLASTTGVFAGEEVDGPDIAPDTQVLSVGSGSIVMNKAATGNGSAAVYFSAPVSTRGIISHNIVSENPVWEALDTHSGRNIVFIGNEIRNCLIGINVGSSGSLLRRAPKNITISGNNIQGYSAADNTKTVTGSSTSITVSSAPNYTVTPGDWIVYGTQAQPITVVTDQTHYTVAVAFSPEPSGSAVTITQQGKNGYGISVSGSNTTVGNTFDYATGASITGNTIDWMGAEDNGAAIYFHDTQGLSISGNSINNPNEYALYSYYDNQGLSVTGNTVKDVWSFLDINPSFITFPQDYQTVTIEGNSLLVGNNPYQYVMKRGIEFASGQTYNNISFNIGNNTWQGTAANWIANTPASLPYSSTNLYNERLCSTTYPTASTIAYQVGDIVWNCTPSSGNPIGWVDTVAGSPGTWVAMPPLGTVLGLTGSITAPASSTTASLTFLDGTTGIGERSAGALGFFGGGHLLGYAFDGNFIIGRQTTDQMEMIGNGFYMNAANTAGAVSFVGQNSNHTSCNIYSGDESTASGANILICGGSHATLPNYIAFRNGTTTEGLWDGSTWQLNSAVTLGANSTTPQHALNTATAAASNCGSLAGAAGCIQETINGSTHYVPYW